MSNKNFDFIAIGDIVTDAFIRLANAVVPLPCDMVSQVRSCLIQSALN